MDKHRGHDVEFEEGISIYSDTKEPTVGNIRTWCGYCKKEDTPEGHDGCIGTLDTNVVMNACCGHGEPYAYVQFWDGQRISGDEALEFIRKEKLWSMTMGKKSA